jgi:class 3 adenylate cyclase
VRAHPVLLRFDDRDLEGEFRARHDLASLSTIRLAAGLGIALYAVFGLLDTQIAEEGIDELLLMRAGVICCLALALLASYRDWFPRFHQLVVCSAVLVAGLGMASMQAIAAVPEAIPAMGVMLTLIFLFGFVRARFLPAVVTAALLVAAYEVTLAIADRGSLSTIYLSFELAGFLVVGAVACHTMERLWRRDFLRERAIARERERSDALLRNVLPDTIARRLRADPTTIAEAAENVGVLFADIVGFTPLTERTGPHRLVAYLDRLFGRFDELCDAFGAEKIKTIGDGYLAVAGVPDPHPDAATAVAEIALGMRDAAADITEGPVGPLAIRIGVCTGPVLAGVIGRRKFAYDVWGDTVNTASRLEACGAPGTIHLCSTTRDRLAGAFEFEGPFVLDLKGKRGVAAWRLSGRSEQRPSAGRIPESASTSR